MCVCVCVCENKTIEYNIYIYIYVYIYIYIYIYIYMCKNKIIKLPMYIAGLYIYIYWPFCIMVRVFANGLGDWGSIPDWVIPKTQKMVLDSSLLNRLNIIRYRSKVSGAIQGKELHHLLHLGVEAIEKGAFRSPLTMIG